MSIFTQCKNCVFGHKGNHTCTLSSDLFGCMAGVQIDLARDVLGKDIIPKPESRGSIA